MAQNMLVAIPYNLRVEELKVDPAVKGTDLDQEMGWLVDNIPRTDEEACERIMRGAVLLYLHLGGPQSGGVSFGECFGTAIIWEVG